MCKKSVRYNWAGDIIVRDTLVDNKRAVVGYKDRFIPTDIREWVKEPPNNKLSEALSEIPYLAEWKEADCFDERAIAIWGYVAKKITYVYDKEAHGLPDFWMLPEEVLTLEKGDCEDSSFLLCSLLLASGISPFCVRAVLGIVYDRSGSPLGGHCLPPDTKIFAKNGFVDIEEVQTGDYVLTQEGFNKVIRKFNRDYKGKLYKIGVSGVPEPIICTPEHPIACLKTNYKDPFNVFAWSRKREVLFIPAKDLTTKHILILPINQKSYYRLKDINESKAKLLGYYLADGNCQISYYEATLNIKSIKIRFSLNAEKDSMVVKDIVNLLKKEWDINHIGQYKIGNTLQLIVYNTELGKWFLRYGGYPHNKSLNPVVLYLRKPIQHNVIEGILLGDGYYDIKQRSWNLKTIYKDLADSLCALLRQLKVPYTVRKNLYNVSHLGRIRGRSFFGKPFYKINVRLGPDFRDIKTRGCKVKYEGHVAYNRIFSIDRMEYEGKVYNLEVEQAHTYVANHILVHNCWPVYLDEIGKWRLLESTLNTIPATMPLADSLAKEGTEFRYEPMLCFNQYHLWLIKPSTMDISKYLKLAKAKADVRR